MSTVLFELGDGQNAVFCVQKFERNLGPFIWYRYSKVYQVHQVTIWLIVISWRLRAYKWKAQR